MTIVQIIDSLNPGGSERMAVNMANLFAEKGWTSHLIVSRKSGDLEENLHKRVNLHILGKKGFWDLWAFRKLISVLNSARADVIHAHSTSVYWAAIAKLMVRNSKLVWHDHFGQSESLRDNDRRVIQGLGRYLDGVVAVNQKLKSWSEHHFGNKSIPIVMINNFAILPPINTDRRKENCILHLANFRPQKDHLTLLKALRILRDKYEFPHFQCRMVGSKSNPSYFQQVIKYVENNNLNKHLSQIGPAQNVVKELEEASIGVLSSQSEGLPVALLEYGLAGLPAVVTDVGQCSEVVGEGRYGKLIAPQNPSELAAALHWVMNNPDQSVKMGESFSAFVNEKYSSASFLKQYQQFLNALGFDHQSLIR